MLVEPLPITWLQGWPLQGGSLYFLGLVWRQSLALRSLRCSFLQVQLSPGLRSSETTYSC